MIFLKRELFGISGVEGISVNEEDTSARLIAKIIKTHGYSHRNFDSKFSGIITNGSISPDGTLIETLNFSSGAHLVNPIDINNPSSIEIQQGWTIDPGPSPGFSFNVTFVLNKLVHMHGQTEISPPSIVVHDRYNLSPGDFTITGVEGVDYSISSIEASPEEGKAETFFSLSELYSYELVSDTLFIFNISEMAFEEG